MPSANRQKLPSTQVRKMEDRSGLSSWIPCVSAYWSNVSCLMECSFSITSEWNLSTWLGQWSCQMMPDSPTICLMGKSHDVTQAGFDLRSSCLSLPDARVPGISPGPSWCNLKHPSKTAIKVALWITWLPALSGGWHLKDLIWWGFVLWRYLEAGGTDLLLLPVDQIPVVSNHCSASFPEFQENGGWNKRRTKVVSDIKQHCSNEQSRRCRQWCWLGAFCCCVFEIIIFNSMLFNQEKSWELLNLSQI